MPAAVDSLAHSPWVAMVVSLQELGTGLSRQVSQPALIMATLERERLASHTALSHALTTLLLLTAW